MTKKNYSFCFTQQIKFASRRQLAAWRLLVSGSLPTCFQWRRGWPVLPYKNCLAHWGVTGGSNCPSCGRPESVRHCIYDCTVARAFWSVVTRLFGVRVIGLYHTRRRCLRPLFGRLVPALEESVLWQNRCRAVPHHLSPCVAPAPQRDMSCGGTTRSAWRARVS